MLLPILHLSVYTKCYYLFWMVLPILNVIVYENIFIIKYISNTQFLPSIIYSVIWWQLLIFNLTEGEDLGQLKLLNKNQIKFFGKNTNTCTWFKLYAYINWSVNQWTLTILKTFINLNSYKVFWILHSGGGSLPLTCKTILILKFDDRANNWTTLHVPRPELDCYSAKILII